VQGYLIGRPGPIDDYAEIVGRETFRRIESRKAG
jgi:hypothetical protein